MPDEPHPYGQTDAARMLSDGLARASAERGVSLRQVSKRLGYKQAVVLSHMAHGRVLIPIDRAMSLAIELGLDPKHFLVAVLEQRYAEIEWRRLFDISPSITAAAPDFSGNLAGVALSSLSDAHRAIARELVRDTHPKERWLKTAEIATVTMIRTLRPRFSDDGLSPRDYEQMQDSLKNVC